jgi:hypothetical protein
MSGPNMPVVSYGALGQPVLNPAGEAPSDAAAQPPGRRRWSFVERFNDMTPTEPRPMPVGAVRQPVGNVPRRWSVSGSANIPTLGGHVSPSSESPPNRWPSRDVSFIVTPAGVVPRPRSGQTPDPALDSMTSSFREMVQSLYFL